MAGSGPLFKARPMEKSKQMESIVSHTGLRQTRTQHVCLKESLVWSHRPVSAVGARRGASQRRDSRLVSWRPFCSKSRHVLYKTISHSTLLPAVCRTTTANYTVEIFHSKAFAITSCPIIHGLKCRRHMQHWEQLWELLLLQSWLLHFWKAVLLPEEMVVVVVSIPLVCLWSCKCVCKL